MKTKAYGVKEEGANLTPLQISRRDVGKNDVKIEIHYCGVCHSDIHHVQGDWGETPMPAIPGHEIVGIVTKVGKNVSKYKAGDKVGVGCLVDSCQKCSSCDDDLEQFCTEGATMTYGSEDKKSEGHTFGGYSENIVVDENFVLKISDNLDLKKVAPLLCAGITTYSPLNHWKVSKNDKVGVVGLGGLGHMAVKIAAAMEALVVVITTSKSKADDAIMLGADSVLISKNEEDMEKHKGSFDFILNTVPVKHDVNPYLELLKVDKTMVLVGAIDPLEPVHGGNLILQRKKLAGSLIGGIAETQEMLNFCADKEIHPEVEMIKMNEINEAFSRVKKSDVKYRFVIDMKTINE